VNGGFIYIAMLKEKGRMDELTKQAIIQRAGDLMDAGYHCSEAILLSVGGHYLGDVSPQAVRMSSPFAGGIGSTKLELCGALTGGLMVIGGLAGRENAVNKDERCQALAAAYRAEFLRAFGWLKCQNLKEHWIGTAGQESCRVLVEKAAGVLVGVIESPVPDKS
jgi:C_GCAxxG_C_C family probable redox protein